MTWFHIITFHLDKIHNLSECHENREHCQEITRIRTEEREDVLLLKKELTTETNTWARKPTKEEAATPWRPRITLNTSNLPSGNWKTRQLILKIPMQNRGHRGHYGNGHLQNVFLVRFFIIIALMATVTPIYLT